MALDRHVGCFIRSKTSVKDFFHIRIFAFFVLFQISHILLKTAVCIGIVPQCGFGAVGIDAGIQAVLIQSCAVDGTGLAAQVFSVGAAVMIQIISFGITRAAAVCMFVIKRNRGAERRIAARAGRAGLHDQAVIAAIVAGHLGDAFFPAFAFAQTAGLGTGINAVAETGGVYRRRFAVDAGFSRIVGTDRSLRIPDTDSFGGVVF